MADSSVRPSCLAIARNPVPFNAWPSRALPPVRLPTTQALASPDRACDRWPCVGARTLKQNTESAVNETWLSERYGSELRCPFQVVRASSADLPALGSVTFPATTLPPGGVAQTRRRLPCLRGWA